MRSPQSDQQPAPMSFSRPHSSSGGRAALVAVLALIALAIVALIVYLLLAEDAPTPKPRDKPLPTPIEQDAVEAPIVDAPTETEQRHEGMRSPYPWVKHLADINRLKQPPQLHHSETFIEKQGDVARAFDRKITIRAEGNLETMIEAINAHLTDTNFKIKTGEPAYNPHVIFKLFLTDVPLDSVLAHLDDQSPGRDLDRAIDPRPNGGISIGTTAYINTQQREAHDWDVERRLAKEHADPILDKAYRPDYVNANVEAVASHIHAQTGIPVIADELVWERQERITWRGDSTTLRDALKKLCQKLRCTYRVQNGRVYLMVIATSM